MLPIREVLGMFAFEPLDAIGMQKIAEFLNNCYPEASWTVSYDYEAGGLKIDVAFDTPEQETFYRLKWA